MPKLSKDEVERTASKYLVFERFRHTLASLSQCTQFLKAREQLLADGFYDWQIFDATIAIVFAFRFGGVEEGTLPKKGRQTNAYIHNFFEYGDEPMPDCESWSTEQLRDQVLINGLAWLYRRGLPVLQGARMDEIRKHLVKYGFFEVDPKPDTFAFPKQD